MSVKTYVPVGGSMAEIVGDPCGIPMWVKHEDYAALVDEIAKNAGGVCQPQGAVGCVISSLIAPPAPSPDLMVTIEVCPGASNTSMLTGHFWSNPLRDGTVECLWCGKRKPATP